MGALIGRYGKNAQRLSKQFLSEGLYGIAATDLHSPVGAQEWVSESLNALEKLGGAGTVNRLASVNQAAILAGQPL